MKSLSQTLNGWLGRLDLHVSRASSFRGLQAELARRQGLLDEAFATLKREAGARELERMRSLSQTRWRGDEPDAGLTWGVRMEGDAFVHFLRASVPPNGGSTIVEIGPGYGRILESILELGIPFRRYIGLELSAARVRRLCERFRDPRCEFREADVIAGVDLNGVADLTLSSAVFEHLYPDFGPALNTISQFTRPGGAAVIDFIRDDNDLERSDAWFENETTYIRLYSPQELRTLFGKSGFTIRQLERLSFGGDINGREITRTIAFATKGEPLGTTTESMKAQLDAEPEPFEAFVHRNVAPYDDRALEPPMKTEFRSSFGGFWTDLSSTDAVLSGKVAIGDLSPAEARLVRAWRRDGFVILPGAVSSAAIDAALVDFERAYDGLLQLKMSFWDSQGLQKKDASRDYLRNPDAKLLDLHAASEAVQAVIFAPPISRFLHILFQRPALAFQSLGFYYGSQQGLHQDVAFVRVSSPLEFVASWIALEDISPGSGELEYYPDSHAIPLYLFGGRYPWVDNGDPELPKLSEILHARAREAGLSIRRFLPKKGDVLIWAAGLMHGGSPVTDSNRTRKSLVTHYCPADLQPMYGYKGGRPKRKSISGHYVMADIWE